jgi:tetratricopeptide (TPR) repeat protein
MGKKEEAGKYFDRALTVAPKNKSLLTSYANYLAANDRTPDAIEIYLRLKRDFPRDYKLPQLLGMAYGMRRDFDRAIESFKEANAIKATAGSYCYLALSFKEKGDTAEAIRALERYLVDPSGEPETRIRKVRADLERLKKLSVFDITERPQVNCRHGREGRPIQPSFQAACAAQR